MTISPIYCPDTSCFWSAHGIPDAYTEARAWHLAAHRAEEHGEPLTGEQIAYATRVGHVLPSCMATFTAVPSPADAPVQLDDQRLAEIAMRDLIATKGPWGLYEDATGRQDVAADLTETGHGYRCRRQIAQLDTEPIDNDPAHREWTEAEDREQVRIDAEFIAHAREDVPALLAEGQRLKAELAELNARARRVAVSHEHFIWDHSDPGTEALASQYELVNYLSAMPGETELPVNPVENALRLVLAMLDEYDENVTPGEIRKSLAEFLPRDDASDNRRRLYVDGKGNAWIDASVDVETGDWDLAGITDPWKVKSAADVREHTGSLREIGRCW